MADFGPMNIDQGWRLNGPGITTPVDVPQALVDAVQALITEYGVAAVTRAIQGQAHG